MRVAAPFETPPQNAFDFAKVGVLDSLRPLVLSSNDLCSFWLVFI